jgi:hypothetical protein
LRLAIYLALNYCKPLKQTPMETIKIKARTYSENEFEIPKYFKIAHHYYMILDDKNYLFVKSNMDEFFYPEISIGKIEAFATRWFQYVKSQDLIGISEQEFKDEYTKANVLLLNFLN